MDTTVFVREVTVVSEPGGGHCGGEGCHPQIGGSHCGGNGCHPQSGGSHCGGNGCHPQPGGNHLMLMRMMNADDSGSGSGKRIIVRITNVIIISSHLQRQAQAWRVYP